MEIHESLTRWDGATGFDAQVGKGMVHFDSSNQVSPKRIILNALAACSGYDVTSILEKKRIPIHHFEIAANGHLTDEHPRIYADIELIYRIAIPAGNEQAMEKAVALSMEKYCGVHAMLHQACRITYRIDYLPFPA
jgi:putative redox protein